MAKDARAVRDVHQKNIVKLFSKFDGSKNRRKIFDDFVMSAAIAISNVCDKEHAEKREDDYLQIVRQYKPDELDVFAEMMAEIVLGMEDNPDQDFLGEMYMALDFGNSNAGQFFTPYDVCRMTASITAEWNVLQAQIERKGFVSVSDPACGAGALLVAFANECRRNNVNYQQDVLFVAQDLDYTVGMMCYIALSLMGCAGYVVIGNTLTDPSTSYDEGGLLPVDNGRVWYTPMYFSDLWYGRRLASHMSILIPGAKSICVKEKVSAEAKQEAPAEIEHDFEELESGQLSFF